MDADAPYDARQRVLVVEDDADMRTLLILALDGAGYAVRTAAHGQAAQAVLRHWLPDLIILDLMMPARGGWTFLDAQRADERLTTIPVVVLTACRDVTSLDSPVVAILHKPFRLRTLRETIDNLTRPDESAYSAQ
jgi:CheY-like chemotaxis protein